MPLLSPCIAFLGANTPWVYALASALAQQKCPAAAIALYDWSNYYRLRPRWPEGACPPLLQRELWVLPPGYVGTLASLFAPLLHSRLSRLLTRLAAGNARSNKTNCRVVVPYPWFAPALRKMPGERLIYFNLDDYVLYQPSRSARILRQEADLVTRAALTLCLSKQQVETLRTRYSHRAATIRHFPLGLLESYLNPGPDHALTRPTVGYIGNLTDRVDWRLVGNVARALPEVSFLFFGSLEGRGGGGRRPDWKQERAAALALPNVHNAGNVPQDTVREQYWSFGLSWIPYATDHAFNQAACPTKIMDGLGSGRPIISTDIPECRLYPEWITIIQDADEAIRVIRRLLAHPPDATTMRRQLDFARGHLWSRRAETLLEWLKEAECN